MIDIIGDFLPFFLPLPFAFSDFDFFQQLNLCMLVNYVQMYKCRCKIIFFYL